MLFRSGTSLGTLPAPSGGNVAFVSKFDSLGNYLYSRIVDGTGNDYSRALTCDTLNNMYFGGYYDTAAPTIKDQAGTSLGTLPAPSGQAAFVSKFDSNGNYLYSFVIDGSSSDFILGISADSLNSSYITGYYSAAPTIKFVNSSSVSTNVGTLPSPAFGNASFTSKFDSNGNYQYSIVVNYSSVGVSSACDSLNNMYFGGYYDTSLPTIVFVNSSNVSTNVGLLISPSSGSGATFVTKFNSTGTYQYSFVIDGAGADIAQAVATDSSNSVYVSGYYNNSANIYRINSSNVSTTLGILPIPVSGSYAAFVTKLDSSGNYQYSCLVDSSSTEASLFCTCDASNNMYFTGYYNGTASVYFVNSSNVSTNVGTLPTSAGGQALFVTKFNSTGTYQYSRIIDGTGNDNAYSVTCDSSGNIYVSGYYDTAAPTIKDQSGTSLGTLPAPSGTAAFVVKFGPDGTYYP